MAEASVVRQTENSAPTNNWVRYTRLGTPTSSAQFIIGPAAPPLGVGSYRSHLALGSEKAFLFTYDHVGTTLSSITGLSYATYNNNAATVALPSINIQIDVNGGTLNTGEFCTLVYEPYQHEPFLNTRGFGATGMRTTPTPASGGRQARRHARSPRRAPGRRLSRASQVPRSPTASALTLGAATQVSMHPWTH